MLGALVSSGHSEDTAVAFLGDHGWSLGEHQEWAKYGNFDVDTRVPLILHDPRKRFLSRRDNLVI